MSFVKNAAKKVFKVAKKVIKKVWKPVLIGAAIAFTGGLATVGFAGLSNAVAANGLLGGIGTTMLAGAQAIGGTLGLTQGLSSGVAAATGMNAGTTLGSGILAQALGAAPANMGLNAAGVPNSIAAAGTEISTSSLAGLGGASATGAGTAAVTTGSSNFLRAAVGGIRNFAGTNTGRMIMFNAITQGIQGYIAGEQADEERKRAERSNFFGGPMRGGSSEAQFDFPTFSYGGNTGGNVGPVPGSTAPVGAQPPGLMPPQQGIMAPGNLDLMGPEPDQQGMIPMMGGFV